MPTVKTRPQTTDTRHAPTGSGTTGFDTFVTIEDTLKAEILWTLKMVTSHFSFSSTRGMTELFRRMFPDSSIASKFALSETKARYFTSFGLGPYFLDMLKAKARSSDCLVLLFDETLNAELQKKQLDIHVRLWSNGLVNDIVYHFS